MFGLPVDSGFFWFVVIAAVVLLFVGWMTTISPANKQRLQRSTMQYSTSAPVRESVVPSRVRSDEDNKEAARALRDQMRHLRPVS